ncbi:MAG: ABC transporter substrate-binding protein [Gemmataceae bacterium]
MTRSRLAGPSRLGTALCFVLAAGAAGCAPSHSPRPRLVLISPHRDELREEVALAFQKWVGSRADSLAGQGFDVAQGVDIVWQDIGGGTSQITRYLESNPGGTGIDVLFGGGTEPHLRLAGKGLLEKIDLPQDLLARIPLELNGVPLRDPEGRWYGPMLSSFGILYNRRVLDRIGQSPPGQGVSASESGDNFTGWSYLGKPGLRGWVGAGDPRVTGSLHMVYELILQSHGWDDGFRLLLRLGANTHRFIRDSGSLTREILDGEAAAAGNLDANALGAVSRDPEGMGYYLPTGETIINPDAISVLKGAPDLAMAKAFVEFTLSDEGQKVFLLQPGQPGGPERYPVGRMSVVPELYKKYPPEQRAVGDANPFNAVNTFPYDSRLGNSRWDALNDLFGAVIMDAHSDLSAAWEAVQESQIAVEEKRMLEVDLFQPPCSHADLAQHACQIVEDGARVRNATVNDWGEQARERYRTVLRRARGR